MLLLESILYYVLFASSVLIYGIGLNRIASVGFVKKISITFYIKFIINIFSSSVLGWLITYYILLPLGLTEIFPLVVFLVYICINAFLEALVRITTNSSTAEFILSYLIVILSIMESTSLLNSIIICFCCIIEMLLLVPFIFAFKKRLFPNDKLISERYYAMYFAFLGVIVLILCVWDVAWINPGVIL